VTSPAPSGVLVVDKPRGPTSHDAVARIRRALATREVGHAGTLDPMATGVLVVAVGEATRLVPWLVDRHKTYVATLALGTETDTLDAEGRETTRVAPGPELLAALEAWCPGSTPPLLEAALAAERARSEQAPPAFSAIQQAGERAYARARRGEVVVLAPRPVSVQSLEILACSTQPAEMTVAVTVSKGYYVRAPARDLAACLGTVAHLTALRRTRSGCFDLAEAVALESPPAALQAALLPAAEAAARALPVATLTEAGVVHAHHGRRVGAGEIEVATTDSARRSGPHAWLDGRATLVAVGEIDADGAGRVLRGFPRHA
jgi:tRNA pseudouridine55 synthase